MNISIYCLFIIIKLIINAVYETEYLFNSLPTNERGIGELTYYVTSKVSTSMAVVNTFDITRVSLDSNVEPFTCSNSTPTCNVKIALNNQGYHLDLT